MNYYIDNQNQEIILDDQSRIPLYSPEGFKIISDLWLKVGWDQKYLYSFTWMGRPIIQLPDDVLRIQEVIYAVKPDVIIEIGIAHGGGLVLFASMCKSMGESRVIGIDIEIRPHNRKAIENHELFSLITLIEGNSVSQEIFEQVKLQICNDKTVLVILDSYHSYDHVLKELVLYSKLVSVGSYIVATDGSQENLHETPRAKKDYAGYCETWETNNPKRAIYDFVKDNPNFKIKEPKFPFNEGSIDYRITHWPSAFIKRIK